MASTAAQLAALSTDMQFMSRVIGLAIQQAQVVYAEAPRAISAISLANPGVITSVGHGLTVGVTTNIVVSGSNSTPSLNGVQSVYVVSSSQLRTNINVTGAGTAGTFTVPARLAYATYVMANPSNGGSLVKVLANSTNLIAGNVTMDWVNGRPTTDVTDAAIVAQLGTIWSMLAGV